MKDRKGGNSFAKAPPSLSITTPVRIIATRTPDGFSFPGGILSGTEPAMMARPWINYLKFLREWQQCKTRLAPVSIGRRRPRRSWMHQQRHFEPLSLASGTCAGLLGRGFGAGKVLIFLAISSIQADNFLSLLAEDRP